MSNKIKVWDKTKKQWLDYEEIYIGQDGKVFLIEERNWSHQTYMHKENITEKVDIVRHTGLKDKNGREIYEGDILKFGHLYNYAKELQVVSMDEFMWGTDEFGFQEMIEREYRFEVIGNIYENPELLKE